MTLHTEFPLITSSRSPRRFAWHLAGFLLLAMIAVAPLRAQTRPPAPRPATAQPVLEGIVKPTPLYQRTKIAIPFFDVENVPLETETLSRIIRRDLELSGYFQILDAQEANRQNLTDVRRQEVDWAKWTRLGVDHYLMGKCQKGQKPGDVTVTTLLYDIPSKSRVFGKQFYGTTSNYRDVAHQISDEVVKYIKGADGIARTRLTYVTDRTGQGIKEVAVMDADGFGQNEPPLTRHGKLCVAPTWGANGTEVYFTSYRDYNPDLYGVTVDGTKEWQISRRPGLNTLADWCPRLARIVLVLSKDGNSELYTCDRTGQNLRRLTTSRYIESSPSWSPDGSMIAFTSDRDSGSPQVYVMNSNGTAVRRLTRQGGWNDAPVWSPKGDKIAFVSRSVDGRFDIYTCSITGENSTWRRLTMGQGDNEAPTWASDGRHIAFASNRTGKWQVYLMLDDGSNQHQLTFLGGNQQPSWGPAVK